jgi:putative isomerase
MRTKLACKDESSMDNSPIHDEARYDPKSGCLDQADVGLNSLLVLDGEVLALFARRRGDVVTAERLETRATALRARIGERLWDPERQVFANRRWHGAFIRSIAPTSFYPLLAGVANADQQEALLRWLEAPQAFGDTHRLPSVTRDDPAYHDNVYWRGRVWPPLNYLTYAGLKRCGHDAAAAALAKDSVSLFAAAWSKRQMPENFSAESGIADDQPDTDTFYGWGGLMPLIGINEAIDVSPWAGWEINPRPGGTTGDWRLGPLLAFGAPTQLAVEQGWLTITIGGTAVLKTDLVARLRRIELGRDGMTFECQGLGTVVFPGRSPASVRHVRFDGHTLAVGAREGEAAVGVPVTDSPRRLEVRW